jgi:YHS domain-containing protein
MNRRILALASLLPLLCGAIFPGDAGRSNREADQKRLAPYAGLVGPWKGTGQVQRGSAKGAWRESASWAWKLSAESAALNLTIEDGKYLKSALLKPAATEREFAVEAVLADGTHRRFTGKPADSDVLALLCTDQTAVGLAKITLKPLHETRFLLLLEGKNAENGRLNRLGEVGFTRQGVSFAAGASYPLCVVTEGRGTIRVQHQGKTYFVCCDGCRELFESDPDAVIAEAKERAEKNAREKASK